MSRSLCLFVVLALLLPTVALTAQDDNQVVDLVFIPHVAMGAAEQDVLVPVADEEGMVRRVAPDDPLSMLSQPVFASTTGAEHDPFQVGENPVGPYEQAGELGFTLGEWLAATGSGTYAVNGDSSMLETTFTNLVPNGVYTMWCSTIHVPPNFEIINFPCGAEDGSQNVFMADEDGNATYNIEILVRPLSTEEALTAFAISYHSDGNTYGSDPGTFGMNSHVQIVAFANPPME
jgi:hypothetical protein